MPTPFSHAAVGLAIATWAQQTPPARRVCLVAAACAVLPDIDVVGFLAGVPSTSVFSHRGITHSFAFAILAAYGAAAIFFRARVWAVDRSRIVLVLGLALLSHICLDLLSNYARGLEVLAPFSQQRFRFPWTPLALHRQPVQEVVWLVLPASCLTWLGFRLRRTPGAVA